LGVWQQSCFDSEYVGIWDVSNRWSLWVLIVSKSALVTRNAIRFKCVVDCESVFNSESTFDSESMIFRSMSD